MNSNRQNSHRNPVVMAAFGLLIVLLWLAGMILITQSQKAQGKTLANEAAQFEQMNLSASQDNGLYEPFNGGTDKSNALGQHVPVGLINVGKLRRALYAFDIAGQLPADATIISVTLQLSVIRDPHPFTPTVSLHKVTSSWGETTSKASGAEGQGADPGNNDVTWSHRFYSNTLWTTAGGDFVADASAQTDVGGIGDYTWSSPQMVADVQFWLTNPASNFGWIVRGEETIAQHTKRFETRESVLTDKRPRLLITYQTANPQTTATATATATATVTSFGTATATATATVTPFSTSTATATQTVSTATNTATATSTATAIQDMQTQTPPPPTATVVTSPTATQTATPQPTKGIFLPIIQR